MTDFNRHSDEKLERMLRLYGTAVRAEADERFTSRRERMISQAVRARSHSWFERLASGAREFFDPRFAGGMAAGVTAVIALLVVYNPKQPKIDFRTSNAAEARPAEFRATGISTTGNQSRGSAAVVAASKQSPSSGPVTSHAANGTTIDRRSSERPVEKLVSGNFSAGELAMRDLLGAFTPPEEDELEVAAIWPESDDADDDVVREVARPQTNDGKSKQEEDELEEFYLDDDQTA